MRCLLPAVLALAACSTASLPPGQGRGLIAFDPVPPPGAPVWPRPTPVAGSTFTLLQGGQIRLEFTVGEVSERGSVLVAGDGQRWQRDADLGNVGVFAAAGDAPLQRFSPVDVRYHWPLWVGKKWRCEFADRRAGAPALLLEVSYEIEALDTIRVPAGTFAALRIVRTRRLVVPGERYTGLTDVSWYSPEVGFDVRQFRDGTAFELAEWTRGAAR